MAKMRKGRKQGKFRTQKAEYKSRNKTRRRPHPACSLDMDEEQMLPAAHCQQATPTPYMVLYNRNTRRTLNPHRVASSTTSQNYCPVGRPWGRDPLGPFRHKHNELQALKHRPQSQPLSASAPALLPAALALLQL